MTQSINYSTKQAIARSVVAQNKNLLLLQQDQRSITTALPYYYHVHLHMPCNQRCIMCVPDGRHPKDTMPLSSFKALVERVKPYAEHITLLGGEPLLYPWINEALDLLAAMPVAVTINTNATLLDEAMANRLLKLHELHLKFSIDAASPGKYYEIRGTNTFDQVTKNIEHFINLAAENPSMKPILVYVVMRKNLDEVVPFVERFKCLQLERIEFHPVRHVANWVVENKTGWLFRGEEQICESFKYDYNQVMKQAEVICRAESIDCEVHLFPESKN